MCFCISLFGLLNKQMNIWGHLKNIRRDALFAVLIEKPMLKRPTYPPFLKRWQNLMTPPSHFSQETSTNISACEYDACLKLMMDVTRR